MPWLFQTNTRYLDGELELGHRKLLTAERFSSETSRPAKCTCVQPRPPPLGAENGLLVRSCSVAALWE